MKPRVCKVRDIWRVWIPLSDERVAWRFWDAESWSDAVYIALRYVKGQFL